MVLHQPVGVAVLVTPWNFPAAMATRKIGTGAGRGCTVILKPASETPLTALLIAQILEDAGVPPGVVNVVPSRRVGGHRQCHAARPPGPQALLHRIDRGRAGSCSARRPTTS